MSVSGPKPPILPSSINLKKMWKQKQKLFFHDPPPDNAPLHLQQWGVAMRSLSADEKL